MSVRRYEITVTVPDDFQDPSPAMGAEDLVDGLRMLLLGRGAKMALPWWVESIESARLAGFGK